MGTLADPFKLVNEEIERKEQKAGPTSDLFVEAFQIIRIKKLTVGIARREIIDTIYIKHGNVDLARTRAIGKARMIGNCMVIEQTERVVATFDPA